LWRSARQKVKDRKSDASNGPFEEGRLAICMAVYLQDQKQKRGKERSRRAVLRHGGHTKKAKILHREAMTLIRQSKNFLQLF